MFTSTSLTYTEFAVEAVPLYRQCILVLNSLCFLYILQPSFTMGNTIINTCHENRPIGRPVLSQLAVQDSPSQSLKQLFANRHVLILMMYTDEVVFDYPNHTEEMPQFYTGN